MGLLQNFGTPHRQMILLGHRRAGGDGVSPALLPLITITTASHGDRRKERLGVPELRELREGAGEGSHLLLLFSHWGSSGVSGHPLTQEDITSVSHRGTTNVGCGF